MIAITNSMCLNKIERNYQIQLNTKLDKVRGGSKTWIELI